MEHTLTRDGWQAVVHAEGAELVSLTAPDGTSYLWHGDPAYWSGRNPVLFPLVGRLTGDQTVFEGRPFQLNKHGFARRSRFTWVERGAETAVLTLRESEATLAQYPYPFRLTITHHLTGEGFSTEYQVKNPGDRPMPFCIGGHPAIRCPLHEGERFEDYDLVFDEEETCDLLRLRENGHLNDTLRRSFLQNSRRFPLNRAIFQEEDTLMPTGLRSHGVALLHRGSGHGVHLDAPDFPMLAFWTPPEAPFLCLEPWHGCPPVDGEGAEFSEKRFCITLQPGEETTLTFTLRCV